MLIHWPILSQYNPIQTNTNPDAVQHKAPIQTNAHIIFCNTCASTCQYSHWLSNQAPPTALPAPSSTIVSQRYLSLSSHTHLQPRPAFSSEIFKCRFCKMKLDDDVNKSILAAAVCRFHMKCVMPLRRATTRCPHSSLFGRQNCCQWQWFRLITGREGWEKILWNFLLHSDV